MFLQWLVAVKAWQRASLAVLLPTLLVGALTVTAIWVRVHVDDPFLLERPQTLQVNTGDTLNRVLQRLHQERIVKYPRLLWYLSRLAGESDRIIAGEYLLRPGESLRRFLRRLTTGEVIMRRITFPEGWTFRQMLQAIHARSDILSSLMKQSDQQIMQTLGYGDELPEGRFFPDTYRFQQGAADADILRRAYQAQSRHLGREWDRRAAGLPLTTPYEALILASIVEKEASVAGEREMISGVYIRRLQRGMKLQADATVIYGLGERFDGNLTRQDLSRDTPYNSYTRKGLPPTPIANPGLLSIQAALHPDAGDALYYVARGDGTHQFSATLKAHNRAVGKYQLGKAHD